MKQTGLFALAAVALLTLLVGSGCPAPSSAKEILSFSFAKATNPSLNSDREATISGTTITAIVGLELQGLVATFETTGRSVSVGGTEQISGVTPNDFTNPVTYVVTAADGSTQEYTANVSSAAAN